MELVIAAVISAMILWGLVELVQTVQRWQQPGVPDQLLAEEATAMAGGDVLNAVSENVDQALHSGHSATESAIFEGAPAAVGHLVEGAAHLLHH
jgi:hypothetical protein